MVNAKFFVEMMTRSNIWFDQAEALQGCAKSLLSVKTREETPQGQMDYMNVGKMLYGMAIEAALKGRIIRDNPDAIELVTTMNGSGELRSATIRAFGAGQGDGHDLVVLAKEANVLQDPVYIAVLVDLTKSIRWFGRYPGPKSVKGDDPNLWKSKLTYGGRSISQAGDEMLHEIFKYPEKKS